MNNKEYDNWKLATPDYYDNPDVYEAEIDTYWHHNEQILSEFEIAVQNLAKEFGLFLDAESACEDALERQKGEY